MDRKAVAAELVSVARELTAAASGIDLGSEHKKMLVAYGSDVTIYVPSLTYQYSDEGELSNSVVDTIKVAYDRLEDAPKIFRKQFMSMWRVRDSKEAWRRLVELVTQHSRPGDGFPSSGAWHWLVGLSRKIPQRYLDAARDVERELLETQMRIRNTEEFRRNNAKKIQKYLRMYGDSEKAWDAEDEVAWQILYKAGY